MRNQKAKRFAEALRIWDEYKAHLTALVNAGKISKKQYNDLLAAKAEELDL